MRHRSRSTGKQQITQRWGLNPSGFAYPEKLIHEVVQFYEDIQDTRFGRKAINTCRHARLDLQVKPWTKMKFPILDYGPDYQWFFENVIVVDWKDVVRAILYEIDGQLIIPPVTPEEIEDQIKGPKQDLVLFVLELAELPALVNVPKAGSEAYLQYKFGLESSANGARSLAESLASLGSDWEIIQSKAGTPQDIRFSRSVPLKGRVPVNGYRSSWYVEYDLTFRVKYGFKVKFDLPQSDFPQMDYIAEQLGIELNPSTFWQLVPLSFVVDWFVPVGQFLKQFDLNSFKLKIKDLGRGWASAQCTGGTFSVKCSSDEFTLNKDWVGYTLYTGSIDYFRRTPIVLTTRKFNGIVPDVRLNPGKLTTIGALADVLRRG